MASAAVEKVCARVAGVHKAGVQWLGKCPAHPDHVASLAIREGAHGKAMLHCHAGCTVDAILGAMGLSYADLFLDVTQSSHDPVQTYPYQHVDGSVLFEVCRYFPKTFKQRRPDPAKHGAYLWNLTGVPRVPYRLPDLLAASLHGDTRVCIVEGEKDADRLWLLDIPATCNAGGAGKWKAAETHALKEIGVERVVIIPDNDAPGEAHAESVAAQCQQAGMAVTKLGPLPGVGKGGDVSDWMAAGHGKADLEGLLTKPYIVPPGALVAVPALPAVLPTTTFNQTDLGNAEAFIYHYGDRVRFDHETQEWLTWKDPVWRRGVDEQVRTLAHAHVRLWQQEAAAITHYAERKALLDYTLRLERSGLFASMLTEAKVKEPIAVRGGWDADPWLLGTQNGVLNLKTGAHRPGAKGDGITKMVGVAYDPTATCPRWTQFLGEIFRHDAELIGYVQRSVGYCLTGLTREQCFFMAYGSGANGKSTFLVTLNHVFGDYARTTDVRTFTQASDAVSYERAMLAGRRLILTSEVRTQSQLNEQILKVFTGGDEIEAQHKYGDPFIFKPVGKIWFAVNHQPKVTDESPGFWRRMRLVPFTQTFTGAADDRSLMQKLREEAPGILLWALDGCQRWQDDGLQSPTAVVEATAAYQEAEDPLLDFFQERCLFGSSYRVAASALYGAYTAWAKKQGMDRRDALDGKRFGALVAKKFTAERTARGRFYLGVALRHDDGLLQDPDPDEDH